MRILFSILAFLCLFLAIPIMVVMLIVGLPVLIRSKRAYKNYILVCTANSFYLVLAPLGYIYAFIKMSKPGFEKYNLRIAVSIDQNGNVCMQ